MGLGHKVAVMVRLIGAAVNEGDRPHRHVAGRNDESWLRRPRPKPCKFDRATRAAARQSNLWLQHSDNNQKRMEETMNIDRRQFALPVLALGLGLMSVVPAFAGADEDAVAKNVEAFRVAQAAGNAEGIASLCAEELSYSHSNAKVDTKASLLDGVAKANYKWTSLEYKDPTVRVVGPTAIVRFNFVGEQEFNDGKKTPQNLHILMNWQKQGNDWKLLSRAATKL
jgi:ketosteroid isomerase-like protein